ncbi:MAG: MogA/MoaB family molybdenum cofactor biosynthesis protein [Planctomycetota bacterium]|jgi:molybdenum cofactor synthesis domain-containing protein
MGHERDSHRFGPIRAAVVTVSDRRSRGEGKDRSGPEVESLLSDSGITVVSREIVPDEIQPLKEILCRLARAHDLILTTGGTGLSPRDVTPEATRAVIDREVPGFAEAMRRESARITPHALISRAVCGTVDRTLIVNLPGSPKGAVENLRTILPALPHAIHLIQGEVKDCAQDPPPAD